MIWFKGIRGKQIFSQNDEDGAIEDVFKHIGTTNKVKFSSSEDIGQHGSEESVILDHIIRKLTMYHYSGVCWIWRWKLCPMQHSIPQVCHPVKDLFFDNCCFFFREKHGWDAKASLLMDGLFENSAINLRKVFILYESETGNDYPHFFKFSKTGHFLAG